MEPLFTRGLVPHVCRSFRIADNLSPGVAHLFDGLPAVIRLEINGAHSVSQSLYLKAFAPRIEHGVFDAVVGGESAYPNFCDAFFAQQLGEIRSVESRVAISAFISSF